PALAVPLVFRLLSALLVFDVIYIMTGGGPGLSTETLSFLNWQTFLVSTDFGYGGAISVMLVVLGRPAAGLGGVMMRRRNTTCPPSPRRQARTGCPRRSDPVRAGGACAESW